MMENPPVFAEVPIDYDHLEVDPRENPLHIQYAYMTKGLCQPSFYEEDERFQEDVSRKTSPKEVMSRKLVDYTTKMRKEDADHIRQKQHSFKVNEKVEDLRRSGKPFYWVDLPRLQKLKRIFEAEKDPESPEGKKAFNALEEYKSVVNEYNSLSKRKLDFQFP